MIITFPDFIWILTGSLASILTAGATFWAKSTNSKLTNTSERVITLEAKLEFIMNEAKRNGDKLDEILKRI